MRQLLVAGDTTGPPAEGDSSVPPKASPEPARVLEQAAAIVGLGGFFPGSASLKEFRRHLQAQDCLFEEMPTDRRCEPPVPGARGSFIADITGFDHELFNIGAREAKYLDPRLRLLMMSTWHALEDAGLTPADLQGKTVEVLIASEESAYGEFIARGEILPYTPLGASSWSLPNRISHAFGFSGRSLFINSACTGGSVALHMALRSLRSGEADYVLVGAANLLYGQAASLTYRGQAALGILSATGTCLPFQQDATGFLPGEAVATVLLRRRSDALRDGDRIHGLVLGAHVNHVGQHGSATAPVAAAQAAAMVAAYADAGIGAHTVTYIEAHGSCTPFGDLEEIKAYRQAQQLFASSGEAVGETRCQITSAKPNVGHANSASGLISLLRALFAFDSRERFGIKDFPMQAGPGGLAHSRYHIEADTQPWPRLSLIDGTEIPRRASIHNFSAGGVNAHVVLQEGPDPAPAPAAAVDPGAVYFLAFSALHEEQLVQLAQDLLSMTAAGGFDCAQLEASGVLSRRAMRCRAVFRYTDLESLRVRLLKYVEGQGRSGYFVKSDPGTRGKLGAYFRANPKLAQAVDAMRDVADKRTLFELWNEGYEEPIQRYLRASGVGRCALPLYPFRRTPAWIEPLQPLRGEAAADARQLHPLVHRNESTLDGVRFSSTFRGTEDFFIEAGNGVKELPGGCLLEMGLAAVLLALGEETSTEKVFELADVHWDDAPVQVLPADPDGMTLRIFVGIGVGAPGTIDFQIADSGGSARCFGRAAQVEHALHPQSLDLDALRKTPPLVLSPFTLQAPSPSALSSSASPESLVEAAWGNAQDLLLQMRPAVTPLCFDCRLPPLALQAIMAGLQVAHRTAIPAAPTGLAPSFASLRQMLVLAPWPVIAWIRLRHDEAGDASIDCCDEHGGVCLQLTGLRERTTVPEMQTLSNSALQGGPRRDVELAGLTVSECLARDLHAIAADVLGAPVAGLQRDDTLANCGFDSISLGLYAKRLASHYGVTFMPTIFFDYSTLARIAEYFLAQHREHIEAIYGARSTAATTPASAAALQVSVRRPVGLRAPTRNGLADRNEPIAIIGISGRAAQTDNIDAMWRVMAEGRDAVSGLASRSALWGEPTLAGLRCGLIEGVAEFDALFFEISPREAESMDPRQRLLLQESMRAIEDAAYGERQLHSSTTGVFVGVEPGQYQSLTGKLDSVTDNSDSVLAARISYFLNLTGPNLALNTACSSGLVAVHLACLSLRTGECDTAVAAAVNLILAQELFAGMASSGMLSADGHCYAFDRRANGMVPGEAVVAVVLKRLSQAQVDGDPIYASILASGVNYDGRTNGITAPSGAAQTRLLQSTYARYSIDPGRIEYIVAHGTGTLLGDPIEIGALEAVFKDASPQSQHCALTSTKPNFGHTFAASGLVSLVCLVQAMRHETIPASLHAEEPSEYIDWATSPFYVNTAARSWLRRPGSPRLGAISAFGVSGTNAHLVLQSSDDEPTSTPSVSPGYLLLLSAKQQTALHRRIEDLIAFLEGPNGSAMDLAAVSHTLAEGRMHYRHRCALLAQDHAGAIAALRQWNTPERASTIYRGQVARDFLPTEVLVRHGDELIHNSMDQRGDIPLYRHTLKTLAELYCQGYTLGWRGLFDPQPPRRVHLPAYPFARDAYWMRKQEAKAATALAGEQLHPLLHRNSSNFDEQRFSSTFTGKEFFFADHVIDGRRVLPGVAYLEMARAAMSRSVSPGPQSQDAAAVTVSNVVWMRQLVADQTQLEVHLALEPQDESHASFKIYTGTAGASIVHCQGLVSVGVKASGPRLDLDALHQACAERILSGADCYLRFSRMGMEYGPGQRGLVAVHIGTGQVLAQLSLPQGLVVDASSYVLHPSLLDSALQAAIGLAWGEASAQPLVPFTLTSAQTFGVCPVECWAWIRRIGNGGSSNDKVRRLDLDLCDAEGQVCVRLQAFTARLLGEERSLPAVPAVKIVAAPARSGSEVVLLEPHWSATSPVGVGLERTEYVSRIVLLCGLHAIDARVVEEELGARCVAVIAEGGLAEQFVTYAEYLFRELQELVISRPRGPVRLQVVVAAPAGGLRGLAGLLKTAQMENPNVVGQLLETPYKGDQGLLLAQLRGGLGARAESEVRFA